MRRLIAIVVLLLLAPSAAAQDDVGVLRNLGVVTREGRPSASVVLRDGVAIFSADDGVHGRELWSSDGTAGGTRMLADLAPGPAAGGPWGFDVVGGVGYFIASAADGDRHVWRTDGTAAGTRRLARLSSGPAGAGVASGAFEPLGDEVVFQVNHSEGYFLAAAGAGGGRVLDVLPPGDPKDLTLLGSTGDALFFRRGGRLYRTDGTRAGTTEIAVGHSIDALVTVGRHAVISGWSFEREGELSTLAPNAARATVLAPGATISPALGGRAYFSNAQGLHSWTPDEGVRDIAGPLPEESSFGRELALADGVLFWPVRGRYGDTQLYSTRGGLLDVHAFDPVGLTPAGGGRVLFHARDDRLSSTHHALWISDGTPAGTRRLTPPNGLGIRAVGVTRDGAILPGPTADGDVELWRTDGTPEGTGVLADINRVPVGSGPLQAARVGGRVVFRTWERGALWSTDGTAAGTQQLPAGAIPYGLTSDGSTAYFTGQDGVLQRTDGTAAGTRRVADVGLEGASFHGVGDVGGVFVFAGRPLGEPDSPYELWRTDGTAAGTRRLQGELRGWPVAAAAGPRSLLVSTGGSLWRTDGTAIAREFFEPYSDHYMAAGAFDGGFLAGGLGPETGYELFRLDADGANPRLVADLYPGELSSIPRAFGAAGAVTLFVAGAFGFPNRWHVTDGTTARVFDAMSGVPSELPPRTAAGVTYVVNLDAGDALLYRTDGTAAGTVLLHRFAGAAGSPPELFTHFNGTTWFAAADPEHGRELWRSDGTPQGTRLARDIRPGRASSNPLDLVATDSFLFFTAYDDSNGAEPWRIRRAVAPAPEEPPSPAPPVTIAPVAPPPALTPPPARPAIAAKATVTLRVDRLRKLRGRTRWRMSGVTTAGACAGPVRVVLGRRSRTLKSTRVVLRNCRFRAIVSTTARSGGRWLQIRTVAPGVVSRRVGVG